MIKSLRTYEYCILLSLRVLFVAKQIADLEARNAAFIRDLRSVRSDSAIFEAEAARHASRVAELENELKSVREAELAAGLQRGESMATALAASEAEVESLQKHVCDLTAAQVVADTRIRDLEGDKVTAATSLSAFRRQTQDEINALENDIAKIQDEARRSEERLEQQLAKAKQEVNVALRETLKTKQELSSQSSDHRLDRESLERKLESAKTNTQNAWAANADTEQQVENLKLALADENREVNGARCERREERRREEQTANDARMVIDDMGRQLKTLQLDLAEATRGMEDAHRDKRKKEWMANDALVANSELRRLVDSLQLELAEAKRGTEDAQTELRK